MAENTEYEQDEVVIVPPQNGGNDDDVSSDSGNGTSGTGGTGGSGDGGDSNNGNDGDDGSGTNGNEGTGGSNGEGGDENDGNNGNDNDDGSGTGGNEGTGGEGGDGNNGNNDNDDGSGTDGNEGTEGSNGDGNDNGGDGGDSEGGDDSQQDENSNEKFESIVIEIINQLKAEFELASAFPSDIKEFCRVHFPKSIYNSIRVLNVVNGKTAKELEERSYDMKTMREFDTEVAKMMLSYIQTNGYYFSPQTAFSHLLYDLFNKLGVFTFTNTKLYEEDDSTYFISIANDNGHLTVYSIVPNIFVQKIIFGSTKNIVKFALWQDRNVTSKKAEDKTQEDYADINSLYSLLNWITMTQRKKLEGIRVYSHEDINLEIASIYIKQLKALKDATN